MLTVAREDEHDQRGDEGGGLARWEDLREHPPCGETERKADDEREDLPRQRMNRNQAGGDVEDRSEKRAEGREGGRELGGTEELRDPREGPVVPVEACDGEEQSVGEDGEDGEEDDVMFGRGAEGHSVIIISWEKESSNRLYDKGSCCMLCEVSFYLPKTDFFTASLTISINIDFIASYASAPAFFIIFLNLVSATTVFGVSLIRSGKLSLSCCFSSSLKFSNSSASSHAASSPLVVHG